MLAFLDDVDVFLQVTVGREQIEPAIQVGIEEEDAKRECHAGLWSQTIRDRFVNELHLFSG